MKNTLLTASLSVVLMLAAAGGYMYAYDYLAAKRQQVFALEISAAEKAQESRQGSTHQLFQATALDRSHLENYFIRQEEVARVVERLERLGREEGVTVEVSDIGIGQNSSKGREEQRVRPVDITVQAVGARVATERFLKRVETFPYILSMEELSLEKLKFTDAGGERWRLALSFRIGMIR